VTEGVDSEDDFAGYGRILCLPQGPVLRFAGPLSETDGSCPFDFTVRAINGLDKYTMPEAWGSISPGSADILLTHETPRGRLKGFDATGRRDDYGSERLAEFIRRLGPRYHFFGHHHWFYPPVALAADSGSMVESVGLNQLDFSRDTEAISQGAFGILRMAWNERRQEKDAAFTVVDGEWYARIRRSDVLRLL
jgi:hypothetical protein